VNGIVNFVSYDKLTDTVANAIKEYDAYHKIFLDKYNSQIEDIKKDRSNCLVGLKDKIKNSIIKKKVGTIRDRTLEIFSANWVCNYQKDSYVKLNEQHVKLCRGFNVLGLKGNVLSHLYFFDTCIEDFSVDMQKRVKEIWDKKEYDHLIIITHDDATCKTNPGILQNYLIFLGCKQLNQLRFRGSYTLVYDLQNNNIIYENCDNQFPIHEWFEVINNDKQILENLGVPVYLIVYNLLYFVKNSVEQLRKYTKNIHIIDNRSTYPELIHYYDSEYEFFLDKMDANYGHLVWLRQMYWKFPKIFAMSDPDLQFHKDLPNNFLNIMKDLTYEYKKGKVGFALDLSDSHLFFKEKCYTEGLSIEEWESRFWLRKIDHSDYEMYNAGVDTTFCVVNKSFEETNNAIRMGGNFTCKHIPWYEGWNAKLDPSEWAFYKNNNISSSTVRMIMKIYNDTHKEAIDLFNEMDNIINKINEVTEKVNQKENITEKLDLKHNLEMSKDFILKNKMKISQIVQNNVLTQ
jgi:hypothetical protein